MNDPTPSDRLALALCRAIATSLGGVTAPCPAPCSECREQSAAVAAEVATMLRERYGTSSRVTVWLDRIGDA